MRRGERYRLGFGRRNDEWEEDDWTGAEVVLVQACEHAMWWCELGGERILVSEERLRGAAFVGKKR